jgi:hypothetical protein
LRCTSRFRRLARAVANDVESITGLVRETLAVDMDDGVVFEGDQLTARVVRDDDLYPGVRIVVPARIDRAQQSLHIDVNDPVVPEPVEIQYPALLDESFTLVGYPIETLLAEMIVTMIDRGDATTRERDFADVIVPARWTW